MENEFEDGVDAIVGGQRKTPLGYIKWLLGQLRHWNVQSYILLFFGMGFNLALTMVGAINWITVLTLIAGLLGLTCTLAINNCKAVNGWLGLISGIMLIIIALNAKNYMDIVMQSSYIILLDVPVLLIPSWNDGAEKRITTLRTGNLIGTVKKWLPYVAFLIVVTALMWFAMSNWTNDPRPFIDSLSSAVGVTSAILTTLKKQEAYFGWLTQGLMSVILWAVTAVQGDASYVLLVTYVLYIMNDILAFTMSPWFAKRVKRTIGY